MVWRWKTSVLLYGKIGNSALGFKPNQGGFFNIVPTGLTFLLLALVYFWSMMCLWLGKQVSLNHCNTLLVHIQLLGQQL